MPCPPVILVPDARAPAAARDLAFAPDATAFGAAMVGGCAAGGTGAGVGTDGPKRGMTHTPVLSNS